jgi:hypothetical protein
MYDSNDDARAHDGLGPVGLEEECSDNGAEGWGRVSLADRREIERLRPRRTRSPEKVEHERRMNEIDRLGDEIAVLSAQIQAATYELLVRLREFDKLEGWGSHGAKSCAHWLAWRTSLDPGAAREWVRVARALEHLPLLSEAMRKGEVSYSKARALTRVATAETESYLVDLARSGTAAHVEKVVRACRRYGPKDERERNLRMHDSRYVHISHDEDGMLVLRARLDPVGGAVLERAFEAAMEALYQKSRSKAADGAGDSAAASDTAGAACDDSACRDTAADELGPGQRRADALVLLAESALAGGLDPGTAGDRYQVVVHVDEALLADPAEQGVSALSSGQNVSAETCRRVACDAAKVVMRHAADGSVLDVGRRTRTISPALRRALTNRDGGCRFPGCNAKRCDAHHLRHWADGGETSLDNTILVCRFHHRLVHEDGFQLKRLPDGDVEFRNPHGLLVPDAPAPPRGAIAPFEALLKRLEDGGLVVDPYTGTPDWDGSPPDLGLAVEYLLAPNTAKRDDERDATAGADAALQPTPAAPHRRPPWYRDPWLAAISDNVDLDDDEPPN